MSRIQCPWSIMHFWWISCTLLWPLSPFLNTWRLLKAERILKAHYNVSCARRRRRPSIAAPSAWRWRGWWWVTQWRGSGEGPPTARLGETYWREELIFISLSTKETVAGLLFSYAMKQDSEQKRKLLFTTKHIYLHKKILLIFYVYLKFIDLCKTMICTLSVAAAGNIQNENHDIAITMSSSRADCWPCTGMDMEYSTGLTGGI